MMPQPLEADMPAESVRPKYLQQWDDAKAQHPGMVLLWLNGDFYDSFREDAELVTKVVGFPISRRHGMAMCGFPKEKLQRVVCRLIEAGYRVAVLDPMPQTLDQWHDALAFAKGEK